jgi:hypothetical protein
MYLVLADGVSFQSLIIFFVEKRIYGIKELAGFSNKKVIMLHRAKHLFYNIYYIIV